jgi:L-rhamnose isomerase/sugar isomerase
MARNPPSNPLPPDGIARHNQNHQRVLDEDYQALSRALTRRGVDLARIEKKLAGFSMALPSWGLGTGGTRFGRFPIPGTPTNIHEKLADAAVVQQLGRLTPRVSLHFPWDRVEDPPGLRQEADALGLGFDAVNSNTFQDQPGQQHSYRHGSLSAVSAAVRDQAIAHNIDCIRLGEKLGSRALTVWIGDGSNFPGQHSLGEALDRYLDSARAIYAALPQGWRMFIEHKFYEPAFYSTVVADWGTSYVIASALGEKAQCLVDLGHHAQGVNIEQIVARLGRLGKLGGFHFNDSKYGDDDLDAGAINPHQLFLVFHELVEQASSPGFDPAYMIDQSHNITDPIESLLASAEAIAGAYARALIVDRAALAEFRARDDVMGAFRVLRRAYETDVGPLLARVRVAAGGAADPIACYRESGWRAAKTKERKPPGGSAGIV